MIDVHTEWEEAVMSNVDKCGYGEISATVLE